MKKEKILTFTMYAIIGIISFLLNILIVFTCLNLFKFNIYAANTLGFYSGLTFGYLCNSAFTFKKDGKISELRISKWLRYCFTGTLGWTINIIILKLLMLGYHPDSVNSPLPETTLKVIYSAVSGLCGGMFNYFAIKTFVFKHKFGKSDDNRQ